MRRYIIWCNGNVLIIWLGTCLVLEAFEILEAWFGVKSSVWCLSLSVKQAHSARECQSVGTQLTKQRIVNKDALT